jgi:hypothetical protein
MCGSALCSDAPLGVSDIVVPLLLEVVLIIRQEPAYLLLIDVAVGSVERPIILRNANFGSDCLNHIPEQVQLGISAHLYRLRIGVPNAAFWIQCGSP